MLQCHGPVSWKITEHLGLTVTSKLAILTNVTKHPGCELVSKTAVVWCSQWGGGGGGGGVTGGGGGDGAQSCEGEGVPGRQED